METQPTLIEPNRLKNFAKFFKNYMSVWSVVVAALPIPVTMLDFIPTYTAHTKIFSVYTSLLCFLLLGFIFYNRHKIGSILFGDVIKQENVTKIQKRFFTWFPGILIGLCVISIFGYQFSLDRSIQVVKSRPSLYANLDIADNLNEAILKASLNDTLLSNDSIYSIITKYEEHLDKWFKILEHDRNKYKTYSEFVLKTTEPSNIPNEWLMIIFYLAIFIFAEAAFIFMALKEYIQDLLGLEDEVIIKSYIKGNNDK